MRYLLVLTVVLLCSDMSFGQFTLVGNQQQAVIQLGDREAECVKLAVQDLISDVRKITGTTLSLVNTSKNKSGKVVIRTQANPTQWESYSVETKDGNLYITGSDERGTMFGIYHFIEEFLKVDPMYFWSGREPEKRSGLSWNDVSLFSKGPSFKFRGWFINDEDLLTYWIDGGAVRKLDYKFYGQMFHKDVMTNAVEALVRSRYNLFIPASFLDIMNPAEEEMVKICARRGVFISQHHQEPMGVSPFAFFKYWGDKGREVTYSYVSHKNEIQEVWREATKKWVKYPNVIWQLGLRGIGDRAIWNNDKNVPQSDEERGKLISGAIQDQVDIINKISPDNPRLTSITLWAEGSVLNQKGALKIPKSTIIVFSDNCPGWKWQEDFHNTPRSPDNSYGVYYHHALIGSGPHLAQAVPPEKTFNLLQTALAKGAGSYAVLNVSNIREFVLGIDATSKMMWDMQAYDPEKWLNSWIGERFSENQKQIKDAYRIFFNSYQIHDKQGVPFLLDGHMFSMGKTNLAEMRAKLEGNKTGAGTVGENLRADISGKVVIAEKIAGTDDAFWTALKDAMPEKYGRREIIRRLAVQKTGFELGAQHVKAAVKNLPAHEAKFLNDNLIYQNNLMASLCSWLENVLYAHESLDLGDLESSGKFLESAEYDLKGVAELAKSYNYGKWANWYRGERIFDHKKTTETTRDLLILLRNKSR